MLNVLQETAMSTNNSNCDALLAHMPSNSKLEDVSRSEIAAIVLNAFLSPTAVLPNSVIIHALRKTSSFSSNLRTLLVSLAVSDLGVGQLGQPLYCICPMKIAFIITMGIFISASFFGIVAIVDRFLSIHLHLRYQQHVTHRRVVIVVIFVWAFSSIRSPLMFLWLHSGIVDVISVTLSIICFLGTFLVYFKIFIVVRHMRAQVHIQPQQLPATAQNADEQTRRSSDVSIIRSSALNAFFIYLVFLVCYLPQFCCWLVTRLYGARIRTSWLPFAWTMVFLNSSLKSSCVLLEDAKHSKRRSRHNS